jgi:hypothetical protein
MPIRSTVSAPALRGWLAAVAVTSTATASIARPFRNFSTRIVIASLVFAD